MKILFVENHAQFVSVVMKEFLSDHEAVIVPSVAAAWGCLTQAEFDVVLVDYDLDDGKGDELVRKIRAGAIPVRIIAVSSHETGNDALQKAGADAVCSKMEFDRIGNMLKSVL